MRIQVQNIPSRTIFQLPSGERYFKWPPGDSCFLGKLGPGDTDLPQPDETCTIVGSVWPEWMPVGDVGRHRALSDVAPGTIVELSNSHRFLVMGPRVIYPMGYAGAPTEPLHMAEPTAECWEVFRFPEAPPAVATV